MEDSPNENFDLEVLEMAISPTTLSDRSLWVLIGVLQYASSFQKITNAEFQREGNMIRMYKKEGVVTQSIINYYPEEAADIIWDIVKELYLEDRLLGENAPEVLRFISEDTEKSVKYISSIYIELIDRAEHHHLLEDNLRLQIKMPDGFVRVLPIIAPSSEAREEIAYKIRSSQNQGRMYFQYPLSNIDLNKKYIGEDNKASWRSILVLLLLVVITGTFIAYISEIGIDITATQYSVVGILCSISLVYLLLSIELKDKGLREDI